MPDKEEPTRDIILHLKRMDPFSPFRIVMATGDKYLIDDPERIAIAAPQLHDYPHSGMGVHLRLNQIAAVEEPSEPAKA